MAVEEKQVELTVYIKKTCVLVRWEEAQVADN